MATQTNGNPELAQRVARLEGAYERVDRQLESLDRRFDSLQTEMTARFDALHREMNARIDAQSRETRILFVATILIMVASISAATAILALLLG